MITGYNWQQNAAGGAGEQAYREERKRDPGFQPGGSSAESLVQPADANGQRKEDSK